MSQPKRQHYIVDHLPEPAMADVVKPLGPWRRLVANSFAQRLFVVSMMLAVWQAAGLFMAWKFDNGGLLLPTMLDSAEALWNSASGPNHELWKFLWETLKSLAVGFAIGTAIAVLLVIFATNTAIGVVFLSTTCAALSTLPAIAILPMTQTWFGITWSAIVAVTTFATVFPVALSMHQGFRAVSPTLRAVGQNLGLTGLSFTARVLVPAALPSILTGLRNGMSNAFRALVATEMVMGAASGAGGLGWMVFGAKQNLEMPTVFAGILAIMIVGLLFEGVLAFVESRTAKRWGMIR